MTLQAGPFAYIDSWERLAERLTVPVQWLELALEWSQNPSRYESRTTFIKGRARHLRIPREPLATAMRLVGDLLQPFSLGLHQSSCGYRPGGSTYVNALPHCGHLWLQKLDIATFYDSTTTSMVAQQFRRRGLPPDVAESLATLVTFQGSLVLGPSTSPTVANLQLEGFDHIVAKQASDLGVAYTRYADDLTFSADNPFDLSELAAAQLAHEGYQLNPTKTRIARRGQSIRVTGLSVDRPDGPRLPKHFKRRLRQELFYASKFGFEDHAQRRYAWHWINPDEEPEKHVAYSHKHLQGKVRYAFSIEPAWTKEQLATYPGVIMLVPNENGISWKRREFMENLAETIRSREEPTAERYEAPAGDAS